MILEDRKVIMQITQLTFTRFFASLIIIVFHFGMNPEFSYFLWFKSNFLDQLLQSGDLGVSYFYVLSGFIMYINYGNRGSGLNKRKYWLLRFARIYPMHILAFLLMFARFGYMSDKITPLSILHQLTLTQAWSYLYRHSFNWPAWSLSVEMFFYFVFPFFIIITNKISKLNCVIGIMGFNFLSIGYQFLDANYYNNIPLPILHLNSFLVGMLGGLFFLNFGVKERKLFSKYSRLISFLSLGVITSVALIPDFDIRNFGLLAIPFCFYILAFSIQKKGFLIKIYSTKFFVLLGEISYSMYILHWPIWLILDKYYGQGRMSPFKYFYFYLFIVIVSSYLGFKFIENPIRSYIKNNWVKNTRITSAN
jgi:peptidoglycan/LPS O-acetylase OafA/YrhL